MSECEQITNETQIKEYKLNTDYTCTWIISSESVPESKLFRLRRKSFSLCMTENDDGIVPEIPWLALSSRNVMSCGWSDTWTV